MGIKGRNTLSGGDGYINIGSLHIRRNEASKTLCKPCGSLLDFDRVISLYRLCARIRKLYRGSPLVL